MKRRHFIVALLLALLPALVQSQAVCVGQGCPTTIRVQRTLTSAEILNLNSSAIEIVPAVAGTTYIPRKCVFYHPAGGTAYTIIGVTGFGVRNGTVGFLCQFNGVGFLNANTEQWIQMLGPGSGSALFSGTDLLANRGSNLNLFISGANPAVGTMSVTVRVDYEVYTQGGL